MEKKKFPFPLIGDLPSDGLFNIPLIKKQNIDLSSPKLITFADRRLIVRVHNPSSYGLCFFVDDYRFESVYFHPDRYLEPLRKFGYVLSPDFSLYADMPIYLQLFNVARNRWCGAYWQLNGIKVIPTLSWSTPQSYMFAFQGIEKNSIVAVSTLGCRHNKFAFLNGYNRMLECIEPSCILCYGKPFDEMQGPLVTSTYFRDSHAWEDN